MHKMEEKMIGSEIEDLINIRKAEIELVNEKLQGLMVARIARTAE